MTRQNYNEIEAKDNMQMKGNEGPDKEAPKKKELTSVVSNKPKKVKKTLMTRLVDGVMGPEGVPGIGAYVNEEIIKPAIKNIIVDAVTSGINMIMYGDKGPGGNRGPTNHSIRNNAPYQPRTNYTSRYTNAQPEPAKKIAARPKEVTGVEEYIIEDRYDASSVLTQLTENADMYDSVSVADYYDLIGVPSNYTDNNYGWTIDNITSATILPVRGGYIIKFPQVEVI